MLLFLKSRTVWTLVLMFVNGGLAALHPVVSPEVFLVIQGVLTLAATYFKLNPSQSYTQ